MNKADTIRVTRNHLALVALAPFLLAVILSAASIRGDFVFDDVGIVRDNARIASIARIPALFAETYWGDIAESHLYRPLTLSTFAVERAVWGVRSAGPYHGLNVVLLGACAAMVGLVALRAGLPWAAALLAGLLFAAHPIHIEPVASVVGRSELGAAVFMLVTLWIALGPGRGLASAAGAGAGAALLAALLFKENAIAVVPVLFLLPLFEPDATGPWWSRLRDGLVTRIGMWIAIVVVLGLWFLLRMNAVRGQDHIVGEMDNLLFYRDPVARIAGALDVSLFYHRMVLWPWPQSADYSKSAIDPATSLASLPVVLGAMTWLALFTLPWLLRRRFPVAGIFLLLYAFALLPVANLLMPIGTIFGERLLFLPSVGICILLAALAAPLMSEGAAGRWIVWGAAAAAVALSATAYALRIPEWRTDSALSRSIVRVQPESAKGHQKLGNVLSAMAARMTGPEQERLLAEAEREYLRAIELHADAFGSRSKLCVLYENSGRFEQAAAEARELMRIAPDDPISLAAEARARARVGASTEALQLYDRAIERHPDAMILILGRALLLADRGETDKAAADFERALALEPYHPDIVAQYVQILVSTGDLAAARRVLDRQLAIDRRHPAFEATWPMMPQFFGQRGFILASLDEHEAAIADFDTVLTIQPGMTRARRSRAASLIALGRFDAAEADLAAVAAAQGPASVATLRRELDRARRAGDGG